MGGYSFVITSNKENEMAASTARKAALYAEMDALCAKTSTAALLISGRALEAEAPSPVRNLMLARTTEELERRYPDAAAAVTVAYDEADRKMIETEEFVDVSTIEVLAANIPLSDQI